jgi:hypothetical protein
VPTRVCPGRQASERSTVRGLRGRGCIPAVRTRPVRRGRRTILYAEGAINERLASFDWELVDVCSI